MTFLGVCKFFAGGAIVMGVLYLTVGLVMMGGPHYCCGAIWADGVCGTCERRLNDADAADAEAKDEKQRRNRGTF